MARCIAVRADIGNAGCTIDIFVRQLSANVSGSPAAADGWNLTRDCIPPPAAARRIFVTADRANAGRPY
jgi:hypothetical protein